MKALPVIVLSLFLAFSASAQQKLQAGASAPEFSAAAADGTPLSLSGMRGKVVLIAFWSTRCQICHSEMPKLNRLAAAYSGKDVVFLGVTMENTERIAPYLKKNPFDFTIVPDGFGMVLQYADKDGKGNIDMGFPAYYLVDQKGTIVMRGNGFDKTGPINTQIGKLLAASN